MDLIKVKMELSKFIGKELDYNIAKHNLEIIDMDSEDKPRAIIFKHFENGKKVGAMLDLTGENGPQWHVDAPKDVELIAERVKDIYDEYCVYRIKQCPKVDHYLRLPNGSEVAAVDESGKLWGTKNYGTRYDGDDLINGVSYVYICNEVSTYLMLKELMKYSDNVMSVKFSRVIHCAEKNTEYVIATIRKVNPMANIIIIDDERDVYPSISNQLKSQRFNFCSVKKLHKWQISDEEDFIDINALGSTVNKCFYSSSYKQGIVEVPLSHPVSLIEAIAPEKYWREVHCCVITKGNKEGQTDYAKARRILMRNTARAGQVDFSRVRGSGYYRNSKGEIYARSKNVTIGIPDNKFDHSIGEKFYLPQHRTYDLGQDRIWAEKLSKLSRSFCWDNPFYGDILMGWIFLAPFCGCLEFRPHIWINGQSSAGKSWIIENFVSPLLQEFSANFMGSTTLHGLIGSLKDTVRPIIHDEFESDISDSVKEKSKIIEYLRLCSTDVTKAKSGVAKGQVGNLGTIVFNKPSSMALLGSVKNFLDNEVDQNRFLPLSLDKKKKKQDFYDYSNVLDEVNLKDLMRRHVDRMFYNWSLFDKYLKDSFKRFQDAKRDTNYHLLRSCAAIDASLKMRGIRQVNHTDHRLTYMDTVEKGIITEEERVLTHLLHKDFRLGRDMTSLHTVMSEAKTGICSEVHETRVMHKRKLAMVGITPVGDGHFHVNIKNDLITYKVMHDYPAKNWAKILKSHQGVDIISHNVVRVYV